MTPTPLVPAPGRLQEPVSLVVVGASGDLARKKVIPALFALYSQGYFPDRFQIVGFARSEMDDDRFRERITERLTCRYVPDHSCAERMDEFLARCFYRSGGYDSPEPFRALAERLKEIEGGVETNRMYYLAVPPFLFLQVANSLAGAGLVNGEGTSTWSRAVIEKPFGKDRASSDDLVSSLSGVFTEGQTFRIDHYLGKEVVQNLLVLRFANLIFDPIWNRASIESLQIDWKEDIGVEDRAGYFDEYGIVRDIVQNHLLQVLALATMEAPVSLAAGDVRDEKVKLLRSIPPVRIEDVVLGQYRSGTYGNRERLGYLQEKGVPADSRTPTFAAVALQIRNRRWAGVPILIRAGKGLDSRTAEIHVQFREVPTNLFCKGTPELGRNELVIRIQPNESISIRIMNKQPGLAFALHESELNLLYEAAYDTLIPDAYESLLLDALKGDESLFIRADELAAAWDVFTPILHELEASSKKPEPYAFGSAGPEEADRLAERYGVRWA